MNCSSVRDFAISLYRGSFILISYNRTFGALIAKIVAYLAKTYLFELLAWFTHILTYSNITSFSQTARDVVKQPLVTDDFYPL